LGVLFRLTLRCRNSFSSSPFGFSNRCASSPQDTFVDEAKGSRDVKVQVKGRAAAVKQGVRTPPWQNPPLAISPSDVRPLQGKDVHIFYGSNITRPQDKWKDEIDNSYDPFIPRITSKPNAKVPLDKVFTTLAPTAVATKTPTKISKEMESHLSSLGVSTGKGDAAPNSHQSQIQKAGAYPHPYDHELRTLEYSTEQLVAVKERIYGTLEATPCHWVDTVEQLTELAHLLESQKEIAIDLEHHQYRSFQGITCLMQISTRDEDYLVDTLELRKHLHILNSSFTNPKIVKVIHGADFDILWLQKDFGLYVVNMFDTGQASRVLGSFICTLNFSADFTRWRKYFPVPFTRFGLRSTLSQ
jgi:exosome complex exonuclease RRP6